MKPGLEELLEEEARAAKLDRLQGFSLRALYALHDKLTTRVLSLEHRMGPEDSEPPSAAAVMPYRAWTGVDAIAGERLPSDRAASISMSAPFGAHVGFKGRGPTRFAMALLVVGMLAAGSVGYFVRSSVPSHEARP